MNSLSTEALNKPAGILGAKKKQFIKLGLSHHNDRSFDSAEDIDQMEFDE